VVVQESNLEETIPPTPINPYLTGYYTSNNRLKNSLITTQIFYTI